MVALGNINEWQPADGLVTTWTPTSAARAAAQTAAPNDLAPSYQQAPHLWAAHLGQQLGRKMPRLMVAAWDIPGVCDISAMTTAINSHLRRHETYRNWFQIENNVIVRRTIANPEDIEFVPAEIGHLTADQIRNRALTATPGTLEWDCFTFGVVQGADHFTIYASVDHLHIDGMSAGLILVDIHLTYQSLLYGTPVELPEAGSYRDFTSRQRTAVSELTMSSPEVEKWIEFAREADGDWPGFPLPLGNTWISNKGDLVTVDLLDAAETESFETVCRAAGARFSGGVMAVAALAETEFTGATTYHGFTPFDTRTPGVDSMTVGWFAALAPVTVPTAGGCFHEVARAAQESFDAAKPLAQVPSERVLELAAVNGVEIKPPTRPGMMLSYLDFRKMPISELWEGTKFGVYADNLSHGGINMWINRHAGKTTVTISFPDNVQALESVHSYLTTLKDIFTRVAKMTSDWVDEVARHANSGHCMPLGR